MPSSEMTKIDAVFTAVAPPQSHNRLTRHQPWDQYTATIIWSHRPRFWFADSKSFGSPASSIISADDSSTYHVLLATNSGSRSRDLPPHGATASSIISADDSSTYHVLLATNSGSRSRDLPPHGATSWLVVPCRVVDAIAVCGATAPGVLATPCNTGQTCHLSSPSSRDAMERSNQMRRISHRCVPPLQISLPWSWHARSCRTFTGGSLWGRQRERVRRRLWRQRRGG
jgi:hypothetical protein